MQVFGQTRSLFLLVPSSNILTGIRDLQSQSRNQNESLAILLTSWKDHYHPMASL